MTDTTPHEENRTTSVAPLSPELAEGRSRLILFVAMGLLALGTLVRMTPVVYGGVSLVALAFALNTAGKLVHYRSLDIPTRDQLLLSLSWLVLAVTVVGLLTTFVYARYGPGTAQFFWPLAIGSVGFGLLHMAAQGAYLPARDDTTDS